MKLKDYFRVCIKLLEFFIYPLFIRKVPIIPKTCLIVKLDGFGDYVLFRNFLYWLRNHSWYKDYKITLIGNIAWAEFAKYFDVDVIDQFIWIDRKRFVYNFAYRLAKLRNICKTGYEVVLYPNFLRETLYGDSIVRAVSSPVKIASIGDLEYRFAIEAYFTNKSYTKLIPVAPGVMFEFNRIKEFFSNLSGQKLDNVQLQLVLKSAPDKFDFPYIVFFVGASSLNRKWPVCNFLKLAQVLFIKYQTKIVFCGATTDLFDFEHDQNAGFDSGYMINLIGAKLDKLIK